MRSTAQLVQRNRNLANDPAKLVPILGALPPGTPVAFEAAYGWGWLVDLLEELPAPAEDPRETQRAGSPHRAQRRDQVGPELFGPLQALPALGGLLLVLSRPLALLGHDGIPPSPVNTARQRM